MPAQRVSDEEQLSSHLHPHTQATTDNEMLPQPQQSNRRVTFEPELYLTQVCTNTKNEGEMVDSKMHAVGTSSSEMESETLPSPNLRRVSDDSQLSNHLSSVASKRDHTSSTDQQPMKKTKHTTTCSIETKL